MCLCSLHVCIRGVSGFYFSFSHSVFQQIFTKCLLYGKHTLSISKVDMFPLLTYMQADSFPDLPL